MGENTVTQLDYIFKPRSIAIIGASNDPQKWGNWSIDRSLNASFKGNIYPINYNESEILGIPAFPNILDVPEKVDLAVISTPASVMSQAMAECAKKKVKGAVVITGGFAEIGEEGEALQKELVKIARQGNIRFVGPNSPGITNSAVGLMVGASPRTDSGSIAFISQSGTLSEVMIRKTQRKGYGLSKFIGIGNQADLNAADYLEYLAQDEATKVIVLYVEGFPEGRKFFDVAREVTKKKPVIIYKVGRTLAGGRATLSHTASLTGNDELFESLCKQAGIIRAYEVDHAFDMAEALATQPLPEGNRVGIISGGGALCVIIAEQCAFLGLEVPEFDEDTKVSLHKELAPYVPIPKNPVDTVTALESPTTVAMLTEKVIQLPYIDGVITNPRLVGVGGEKSISETETQRAIEAIQPIVAISQKYNKPIVALVYNLVEPKEALHILREANIPYYETPEECARAMFALAKYSEFLRY